MMRRNLYFSLGSAWAGAMLAIISSVMVARMMLPEDLGVFTVTMSVAVILGTIQSAGSAEILVYTHEVDDDLRRRVLGLTLIMTAVICATLVMGRPYWIRLFGSPGVADVADIIAVQTAIGAFSAPIQAMWRRNEAFDRLSIVNFVGNAVLSISQVGFVFFGFGYLGLAFAALLSTSVILLLTLILGREHFLLIPQFTRLGSIALYGGKLFGVNALGQIYTQSTTAIIGALAGVAQSALFGRAFMISQIYSQTIGKAVDPILNSRLASSKREGQDGNIIVFLYSRYLLTLATMFFGLIAICSDLIVPLIFGPQWIAAAPAMRILTAGLILMPLTAPTAGMLLALNRPGTLFRVRLMNVVLRIVALLLLTPFGITAVAWGLVATAYLNWLQSVYVAQRFAALPAREYFLMLIPSVLMAAFPLIITLFARILLTFLGMEGWLLLSATSTVMCCLSLVSLALGKHPFWDEIRFIVRQVSGGGSKQS